ncbi:hypothetical protein [Streptomyces montanisoli]|uniref:hypothetical protein n=1 Tax=Streptomyces montanisoli TaxID=2798581 RepID=UPI0027DC5F68|nr:hypothetical protein [Streptomyces montanisoli]
MRGQANGPYFFPALAQHTSEALPGRAPSRWAGVIGGAIAPLVFTALLGSFGTWLPLAGYVAVAAAVTVAGVLLGRDAGRGGAEHPASARVPYPAEHGASAATTK